MKTAKRFLFLAVMASLMVGAYPSSAADEKVAASPKLRELMKEMKPVNSKTEFAALKPGDTIAIACSHCKKIWVAEVPKKGAQGLVAFQDENKVQCPKCGSNEAFCCATTSSATASSR